jgi:hypothetical protein
MNFIKNVFLSLTDARKSGKLIFEIVPHPMKKSIVAFLFTFVLFGCNSPEGGPPDEVGELPEDYIISMEESADGDVLSSETETSETEGEEMEEETVDDDIFACREENAELSLELDAAKNRLADCQSELSSTPESPESATAGMSGLSDSHLQLLRSAILSSDQPEYPFATCGQMGTFFRSTWFDGFTRALNNEKIRFANGFLETEDLFGGCQSTQGKMAFFLGAERGDTISFILLKYDTAEGNLVPALMLDDATTAVVTEFGKREGAFVNFPADDGRVFRYYYDANVVVEAP